MLRKRAKVLACAFAALDLLCVVSAYSGALRWLSASAKLSSLWHTPLFPFVPLIFIATLRGFGAYHSFRVRGVFEEMLLVMRAALVSGAALVVVFWLTLHAQPPRGVLLLFLALAMLSLSVERAALRATLRMVRSHGYNLRYYLIVGTGSRACEAAEELSQQTYWGIRVIGHVAVRAEGAACGAAVLGPLADLGRLLEERVVDGVLFAGGELTQGELSHALAHCHRLGVPALVDLQPFEEMRGYLRLSEIAHSPWLVIGQTRLDGQHALLKRLFDFAAAVLLLILTGPCLLLIALIVKVSSRGPVLFRQQRVGMHGRLFTMLKLRTMVADAEHLRNQVAAQNEMDGPVFKMRNDPRVTWVGTFLRRASLDELPQLFNVLWGDMSLVGPRPPLPHEVAQYQNWQRRRLSVRPGLTCLWQVSGRNAINFDTWMKLDLEYIDNWSWWLDLKILLRTLPAMVRGQ